MGIGRSGLTAVCIAGGWLAAAPVPARNEEELPDPVALTEAMVRLAPSPALRADRFGGAVALSATPVTVPLVCLVRGSGRVDDCMVDSGGKPAWKTARDFIRLAGTDNLAPAAPTMEHWARALGRHMVLRPMPDMSAFNHYVVRTSITVGPEDGTPPPVTGTPAPIATVLSASVPDFELAAHLYPTIALRREESARITATCRVEVDLRLFCRQARLAEGRAPLPEAVMREYALATYQLFSFVRVSRYAKDGGDAVDREVIVSVNWVVGG